jgi:hypothetical protein
LKLVDCRGFVNETDAYADCPFSEEHSWIYFFL